MSIYQLKTFADIVAAIREEIGVQSTDTTAISRIKRNINEKYAEIVAKKRWKWLNASVELTLPAYFNSGTASVNQYSNVVTLTIAPASSKAGYYLALDGYNEIYRIESHVAGTTTVRLATEYTGSTQSGATFRIWTDRLALPTDCKETVEVWHDSYRQGLENVGRQEWRRMQRQAPRSEAKPTCYYTGDFVDPAGTSSIASLPSITSRSSALQRKTIVFSNSLPTAVVTAVNAGEPVRWRISGAGHPSYNGDVTISAVSTTTRSNDTVIYTAPLEYTESAVADTTMSIAAIDAEQDYDRYRELFLYPSLNNTKTTIHVDYIRKAQPLNNDNDEPLIPFEDRNVLKYGGLALSWPRARNPEECARNQTLYDNKVAEMEGKWEDSLETARLSPSRNYLAAKRSNMRKRMTNQEFGPLVAGGSSGAQVITGTPNRLAGFDNNGNLTATAATFSQISALTSLTSGHVYVGNASNVATDVAVSGDASLANTGALTVNSVGGSTSTNVHTAELAANAATNLNTASTIVKRDGSGNFSAGTITASLTGNVTGNVTGTSANVTGTVAIGNGGTGQTTANAAFNALSPMTTVGDIVIGGTAGAGTRLGIGSANQVLTVISGSPAWQTPGVTAINAQSASYTLTATDDTVTFDATGASRVATLPTAVGISGKVYTIKRIDGTAANTVTINTTGAQTIDARASGAIVLRSKFDYLRVQSDGANWVILSKKETELNSTFNGNIPTLSSGGVNNFATSSTSLSLGIGQWKLKGYITAFDNTTGVNAGVGTMSGFYAADGANSAITPTALSGDVKGYTNFNNEFGVAAGLVAFTNGNMSSAAPPLEVIITLTATTTIYLVVSTYYGTAGNSFFVTKFQAERIW